MARPIRDGTLPFGLHEMRGLRRELVLEIFVRLSDGKGLHLVIPIRPERHWPEARQFCEVFAKAGASHAPARHVAMAAKKRAQGTDLHRLAAQQPQIHPHRELVTACAHVM